jgi:anaerobic magnesium-protoporphyrin IX monomethyl ester cyclase
MRVCLVCVNINTNFLTSFNHGVAYLGGALKKNGHEVAVKYLTEEKELDEPGKFDGYDVLGFSFVTNQARYIKQILSKNRPLVRLIIGGGIHPTIVGERIFEEIPGLDAVCIGEGEKALVDLCGRMDRGDEYLTTPSFYFKTESGVRKNPIRPLENIEDLDLPDYGLFDVQGLVANYAGWFMMILSRGCPYNCTCCVNHRLRELYANKEKYVRYPPVDHAIRLIKNNLSLHPGVKGIILIDDIFTLKKDWVAAFCEAYKKDVGIPYVINTRVDCVDDEILSHLSTSGCKRISYGVESGNEWMRRVILGKDFSNQVVREAFSKTRKAKIKVNSLNMVGLPLETYDMAKETLALNMELWADSGGVFFFYPYPNSRLERIALEFDLIPEDNSQLSGFLERPAIKPVHMTRGQMDEVFESLYVLFYLRLVLSSWAIPRPVEMALVRLMLVFKRPIHKHLVCESKSGIARAVKGLLGKCKFNYY